MRAIRVDVEMLLIVDWPVRCCKGLLPRDGTIELRRERYLQTGSSVGKWRSNSTPVACWVIQMMGAGGGEGVRFSEAGRSAGRLLELSVWRQERPEQEHRRCDKGRSLANTRHGRAESIWFTGLSRATDSCTYAPLAEPLNS